MTTQSRQVISTSTIIMTLVLMSLSTLFIGLSGAYIYSRVTSGVEAPFPPVIFYVTIALLGIANFFVRRANRQMAADYMAGVENDLKYALLFTVIFAVAQVIGWFDFFTGDNAIQSSNTLAYLFVLSALHHLHVVAGIPFLGRFILKLRKIPTVSGQLTENNKQYINGLGRYWRFIDILWILLVSMLLISAFI